MSYLEMKGVGRQGPTLGQFLLEVALVRNASRANGMRGMAQRISTTLQQQQTALLAGLDQLCADCLLPSLAHSALFYSAEPVDWSGRQDS